MTHSSGGFTLLELMIVVIIIGMLSAIAIPAYVATVDKFKYGHAKVQMNCLKKEITLYQLENGDFPAEVADDVPSWSECFQDEDIPFESQYDYENISTGGDQCYIGIVFLGKDGSKEPLSMVFDPNDMGFQMSDEDDLILHIQNQALGCGESGSSAPVGGGPGFGGGFGP